MVGFWLSLALLVVAVAGGLAFVTVRGLQVYRRFKRFGGELSERMDRISGAVASVERQLAAAEASMQRLAEANRRLQLSRAQLEVQLAAVREARSQVRRVFWFVPGV